MRDSAVLTVAASAFPATSGTALPLRVELWSDSRQQEALGLWRGLETEVGGNRLTCSSIWVETWLKHYGPLVPHRWLIGRRGAEVVGIALVTESVIVSAGRLAIRTWHLGTAGEPGEHSVCVEFNTLLVRPADHDEFLQELLNTVIARAECGAIAWDGFDADEFLPQFLASDRWQTRMRPTYYFDLRRAREMGAEPVALLGGSTRQAIRRNLRSAGEIAVDWSESADHADEYFSELISFHQARWQAAGEPGAFASPIFREFHRDVLQKLLTLKNAAVVRVRAGRQTIGCTLLYIDRNRALVYQGGWAMNETQRSPGLVSDYSCLCECLKRGYDAYDFMAGDSCHKQRLSTDRGRLVWLTYRKKLWTLRALDQLRAARRLWKSFWTKSNSQPDRSISLRKKVSEQSTVETTP